MCKMVIPLKVMYVTYENAQFCKKTKAYVQNLYYFCKEKKCHFSEFDDLGFSEISFAIHFILIPAFSG